MRVCMCGRMCVRVCMCGRMCVRVCMCGRMCVRVNAKDCKSQPTDYRARFGVYEIHVLKIR